MGNQVLTLPIIHLTVLKRTTGKREWGLYQKETRLHLYMQPGKQGAKESILRFYLLVNPGMIDRQSSCQNHLFYD
jgi:hypothetical protein